MVVIAFALCSLLGLLAVEAWRHRRRLRRIPIRIHVNGTRGKSTVTRLIAGGLRAAGYRVIAKTTGTLPRIILEDGSEIPVPRRGRATIREQLAVIALAARRQADAVVLECMAIQPELQRVSERQIVRATIGVITNARRDHTEIMGQTRRDVAECLALTVPRDATLVVGEQEQAEVFAEAASRLGSRVVLAASLDESERPVAEELLDFPENQATALAVCGALRIDRARACAGMGRAAPDVGALRVLTVSLKGKHAIFVNAFSLNDVDSLLSVWGRLERLGRLPAPRTVLLNCRADRPVRSYDFGRILGGLLAADRLVLMGEATRHAWRAAVAAGLDSRRILRREGRSAPAVAAELAEWVEEGSTVIGAGNFKGAGEAMADHLVRGDAHVS